MDHFVKPILIQLIGFSGSTGFSLLMYISLAEVLQCSPFVYCYLVKERGYAYKQILFSCLDVLRRDRLFSYQDTLGELLDRQISSGIVEG